MTGAFSEQFVASLRVLGAMSRMGRCHSWVSWGDIERWQEMGCYLQGTGSEMVQNLFTFRPPKLPIVGQV